MYICCICNQSQKTVALYRLHLENHKFFGELCNPLVCKQGNCNSYFSKIFNLIRHLKKFHRNNLESDANTEEDEVSLIGDETSTAHCSNDHEVSIQLAHKIDSAQCLHDLQVTATSLVAGLRANSSIPYNVVPVIIESFNSMASSLISFVSQEIENTALKCTVDQSTVSQSVS